MFVEFTIIVAIFAINDTHNRRPLTSFAIPFMYAICSIYLTVVFPLDLCSVRLVMLVQQISPLLLALIYSPLDRDLYDVQPTQSQKCRSGGD